MTPILVAGIGNIFKGDDGFGVAVAQRMAGRPLPAGVTVRDFGIRGLDLTYALLDGYAAVILVDTAQRGEPPGTVYMIEPDASVIADPQPEDLLLSPHELDPVRILRLATALGGQCRRVVLVACEPASFGDDEWGAMELTQPVAAAIDVAANLVEQVVHQLLTKESAPWIPATQVIHDEAAPSSPTVRVSATGV